MGDFSWTHWAIIIIPVLILYLVIRLLFMLLRKLPKWLNSKGNMKPAADDASSAGVPVSNRPLARKVVALLYAFGGIVGLVILLSGALGTSFSGLDALLVLLLFAQIGVALYGSWQYWHSKSIGCQWLYWLSWSCAPVIASSVLTYWCAIGLGFFPTVTMAPGNFSTDLTLRFGYVAQLMLFPGGNGIMFGINVVALVLVRILGRDLDSLGVPRWPLLRPQARNEEKPKDVPAIPTTPADTADSVESKESS